MLFGEEVSIKEGENIVIKFASAKGYSIPFTAGLLSTIYSESSFDPYAVGDRGNSYGLFQFNTPEDRRTKFLDFLQKNQIPNPQKLFVVNDESKVKATDITNPDRIIYRNDVFRLTLEYMMVYEEGKTIAYLAKPTPYTNPVSDHEFYLRTIMGGFEDIERYAGSQKNVDRDKRDNPEYNKRLERARKAQVYIETTIKVPSFDQIVKGNVSIKKLSSHKYKITFSEIDDFLLYQVWDKDSVKLNKKRKVGYLSAKNWVKVFKKYNEEVDKPLYTPTTVMETEDDIYAFVIHKACINSHGQVVFTVSTKEISLQNNTSKKLVQLPCGKLNNVRFDIDSWFDDICRGVSIIDAALSVFCG
jgi:hypothetical protein